MAMLTLALLTVLPTRCAFVAGAVALLFSPVKEHSTIAPPSFSSVPKMHSRQQSASARTTSISERMDTNSPSKPATRQSTFAAREKILNAARPLQERALAITEQVLGPNHPDTAASLNNLAGLRRDQGDLNAARSLYERALAITERVLGPDHPSTRNIRTEYP